MTKQSFDAFQCAVCDRVSLQGVILSTSAFKSPDLDFRPPPLERFTIDHWVQECPHCGYCAPVISEKIPRAGKMVRSGKYRKILRKPQRGEAQLYNQFLCASALYEHAGDLAAAARMALCAAWVADDKTRGKAKAVRARQQVLRLVDELHAQGGRLEEEPAWETLQLIDVARRAKEFDRANRLIAELAEVETEPFPALVAFQRERVAARDTAAYTIDEAMEGAVG